MVKKATKKTSKKTTSTNQRFLKHVHALTERDIFKSVAIASILFNVLFIICFFVLTSTSTFDRGFYHAARNQYCQNVDAVKARADQLGDEKKAINEWQVDCVGTGFQPFYKEALEKYRAAHNE